MTFVDFDICHRKASLQKMYSGTLTIIFDLESLKCEIRLFSYAAGHLNYEKIQQDTFIHLQSNHVSPVVFLCDLDLHFRFQMFKYVKFVRFHMMPES